ncbi:MAG: methyltransferase, partial [Rhizobiales bacterium]|nr:methyltransferase [Hyphomicrobiales bacterium]
VLLAACIPSTAKGLLYDLGAGTGAAGYCAAARAPELNARLVERDTEVIPLAKQGLSLPENKDFAGRIEIVEADILMPPAQREAAGLIANSADWVIANPPFYRQDRVRSSPHMHRREAHVLGRGDLEIWFRVSAMLLKPGGYFSIIHMAEALNEILDLCKGRFGSLEIRPIHPRLGKHANRVIVSGQKGSRGVTKITPGFIVHAEQRHSPQARDILRHGKGFSDLDLHL